MNAPIEPIEALIADTNLEMEERAREQAKPIGIQAWRTYLQKIGDTSAAYPPPGMNAANGHWRRTMHAHRAYVEDVAKYDATDIGNDHLLDSLDLFASRLRHAFKVENYPASGIELLKQVWLKHVISLIKEIIETVFDPSDEQIAQLVKEMGRTIEKVANSGNVFSGAHANGWLSVRIKSACSNARRHLDDRKLEGDLGEAQQVIETTLTKIQGLSTKGHNPWLKAEYQLAFEGACRAGSLALGKLL